VDLKSATVELIQASSNQDAFVRFSMTIVGDQFQEPTLGGVHFRDPARAPGEPHEGWYFMDSENLSFSFTFDGTTTQPITTRFDAANGWDIFPVEGFDASISNATVELRLPLSAIPSHAPFYMDVNDGRVCDSIGLDLEKKEPMLLLPSGIEGLLQPK
jgi:hypothetical protein